MTRHNYDRSPLGVLLGDVSARLAARQTRSAIAVIGASLLLVVALWSWEAHRIGNLDREITDLQRRNVSATSEADEARRLAAIVDRDRDSEVRIARAHRSALASTNAITRIGNVLPAQTWLTTISAAPSGSWQIAGRSTRVAEIGTTLHAIAGIDARGSAHLQAVAATGRTGQVLDFVIGWDTQP